MRSRTMIIFCGLALLAWFGTTNANAASMNRRTEITFDRPTEVPGTVLAPGTYNFQLLNSQTEDNIVQIFNADDTRLVTTVTAIPIERSTTPDNSIFTLKKISSKMDELETWFYPGEKLGWEFTYPHKEHNTEQGKVMAMAQPCSCSATMHKSGYTN